MASLSLGMLGAALVLGAVWVIIFPQVLAPPRSAQLLEAVDTAAERAAIEQRDVELLNGIRAGAVQALAGAVVLATAYFTWQRLRLDRETTRQELELARDAQFIEGFTRGVDQLMHTSPDARLAGIYTLERLAKHREGQHTVTEVLNAFVRRRVPWAPPAPDQSSAPPSTDDLSVRAPDVQTIMAILCRPSPGGMPRRLDLHEVDLHHAELPGANLVGANLARARLYGARLDDARLDSAALYKAVLTRARLVGASLVNADLSQAKLSYSDLFAADLSRARLTGARLSHARLARANLVGANLVGADLRDADLREADLRHAVLREADLRLADLRGADFTGADVSRADMDDARLDGANLSGVLDSAETRWPHDVDRGATGIDPKSG